MHRREPLPIEMVLTIITFLDIQVSLDRSVAVWLLRLCRLTLSFTVVAVAVFIDFQLTCRAMSFILRLEELLFGALFVQ